MEVLGKVYDAVETCNISISAQGRREGFYPVQWIPERALKEQIQNVSTLFTICPVLEIPYNNLVPELINYIYQAILYKLQLLNDPSKLKFLPTKQFIQIKIPVADF